MIKYILDCDPGTDDSVALFLGIKLYSEPYKAVATFGNKPIEKTYRNLYLMKKYLGIHGDIYMGCSKPFCGNIPTCGDFHGEDGLGNISGSLVKSLKIKEEDIYKNVLTYNDLKLDVSNENIVDYIAVGPLTTLATLLQDSDFSKRINRIYIMGGGIEVFNKEHQTEYNFSGDPVAVKKVLSSGKDITLVPLDLSEKEYITEEEINLFEKSGKYEEMIKLIRYNLESNRKFGGKNGAVLHDALTLICKFDEKDYDYVEENILSDEWGHIYRSEKGNKIKIATYKNERKLIHKLQSVFGK